MAAVYNCAFAILGKKKKKSCDEDGRNILNDTSVFGEIVTLSWHHPESGQQAK